MRPILIEINRSVSPRIDTEIKLLPLRWRLLAALPMINVITGLVVAAIAGADSLGVTVLVAIGVATTISLELTVLLSRRSSARLPTCSGRPRPSPRATSTSRVPITTADELGELARVVQPDGRGPARARADPPGLRHLSRPRGRRSHPQRGLLRAGRDRRGLDPLLRRQELHAASPRPPAPRRSSRGSTRSSRSSSRRSRPRAATSTSSRATA